LLSIGWNSGIIHFTMVKQNFNKYLTFFIYFSMLLAGIADATNPGHSLISLGAPLLLALLSFVFGLDRFRLNRLDSLILLVLNLLFLVLAFNTKIFLLNIFVLSLLVWSLAAPYIARFKATFPAVVIIPVVLAFIVPYYKLPYPLLPLLYLPFFMFGYMLESLKFDRNRLTTLYSLLGILVSSALLFNTFYRSLRLRDLYGKIYIQSLFSNSAAFVFAPIIVLGFMLLVFSILILLTGRIDCTAYKDKNRINWRASFLSASVLLPFLYGVNSLHPGRNAGLCLALLLAAVYLGVYRFADRRLYGRTGLSKTLPAEETSVAYASAENVVPERSVNINRLMSGLLFRICYVMAAVISIEYIIRSNDFPLLRGYTSTASFAYNLLFVGTLYLLATSALGLRLGTLLAVLVHIVLLLANYLKLTFFSEPFFPWDVGLIGNALMISRDYVSIYTVAVTGAILLAGLTLTIRNFRKILRFLKPKPRPVFAIILVIPLVFNLHLLGSGGLQVINVFKGWYDGVNEYIRNGTYVQNALYLQNIKNYVNSKPAGYGPEAVEQLKARLGPVVGTDDVKPDVIVILGETFWDPSNLKGVSFNREIAVNLRQYQSGTMISPAFGGGTANVEFEVLTGFSNFFFNTSIMPYNVYFRRSTPSIVSAFKDNGYATVALHPNNGDFYNRNNVYKYIGFDEFRDIKSFDPANEIKGNYVSDDSLVDRIADTLKEKDAPAFILGITMQNHDPYTSDIKNYGAAREIQVESDKLNDAEKDVLANFAQGVHDEDKALGKLIEAAKKNDRPTLIYFYGDHLPRLGVGLPGGNYEIYGKLGFADGKTDPRTDKKFYEVPYVAWSSYKELPRLDAPISPNQLALEILKDSGINYPSYFNSLLEVRDEHPYLSGYLDSKTAFANDRAIQDYYLVQYDLMFGKQYLTAK
jgi:phosphoglycerol transferase MdoB-like AlkP superfamily enzyme